VSGCTRAAEGHLDRPRTATPDANVPRLSGKIVITGAGGYVGGRLVRLVRERDQQVHAVVREAEPRLDVEQTVCDLAQVDLGVLASACEGAETVIHLAGNDEVVAAKRPATALAETIVATERVAEACAANGIKRLVYVSTVHVYGARIAPDATLAEEMRPEPRSAYAISRLASEHVAATLSSGAYDLVVLRLTNSVGAPDDPSVDRWSLVANDLCRQGSLTGKLVLRSSGVQWRDFVPLEDVCSVILAAGEAEDPVLPAGTYNLGSGRSITVRSLAQMIQDTFEQLTGSRPQLVAPEPEADPPGPYHVSVQRLGTHGIALDGRLEDAVAETARFCLDHREELR
jgi:UDP-glucose 4-epimerase